MSIWDFESAKFDISLSIYIIIITYSYVLVRFVKIKSNTIL